jgi:predicted HD superfamily hydrolase involved in NAD metabolism
VIDYFAALSPSGDPAVDVEQFYRTVDRLDTLAHVTQVAAESLDLAARFGADRQSTNLAALAHDLAAVVPVDEMPAVAEDMGLLVSEADRAIPQLLHGPIAAAALGDKLAVRDEDVLNAVRYHSTLRAGASTLEKIVFVADKIAYDPTSPHGGEYVAAMRAARSLDEASLVYIGFLQDYASRYGWLVHPNAIAAHRDLAGRSVR